MGEESSPLLKMKLYPTWVLLILAAWSANADSECSSGSDCDAPDMAGGSSASGNGGVRHCCAPGRDIEFNSARNRTPQQWNQDKTSIAEVKLNKRCSTPYVNINIYVEAVKGQAVEIRGVWKTRTMAFRLTMALPDRSWNRSRMSTSAKKRTPEKWNQDKTSIVVDVYGVACVVLKAAVRGVWKTRTWTK